MKAKRNRNEPPLPNYFPKYGKSGPVAKELIRRSTIVKKTTTDLKIRDTNNCTVNAMFRATGLPYDLCYRFMRAHGRKDLQGLDIVRYMETLHSFSNDISRQFKTERKESPTGYCKLATALKTRLRYGTFIVLLPGHTFAVINGKIQDWLLNVDHYILAVFEVNKPRKEN